MTGYQNTYSVDILTIYRIVLMKLKARSLKSLIDLLRLYLFTRTDPIPYRESGINRWLNSNRRSLPIRNYTYRRNLTEEVPVKVNMWDFDTRSRGSSDRADLNRFKGAKSFTCLYDKESRKYRGAVKGKNGSINTRGYGDSNQLRFKGKLRTIKVEPAPLVPFPQSRTLPSVSTILAR